MRFDCSDAAGRADGIREATNAVRRGELVVLPTDTVYGIGCDAFTPQAVDRLLAAKGRGRDMPVPVLVGSTSTLGGILDRLPDPARPLIETFWPGALTIVVRHPPSLAWDLGEARGTVAVRMPDNDIAIELLQQTGPLAVSSANKTGAPPATTAEEAEEQLGETVAVYLDGGPCASQTPSTIVDVTSEVPRILRAGAIAPDRIREVLPSLSA